MHCFELVNISRECMLHYLVGNIFRVRHYCWHLGFLSIGGQVLTNARIETLSGVQLFEAALQGLLAWEVDFAGLLLVNQTDYVVFLSPFFVILIRGFPIILGIV